MTESVEDATSESEYCSPWVARQSAVYNPSSIGLRRSERICSKGKILVSLEDATSGSMYCAPGVARQSVVNSPGSVGLRRSGCIRSKGVQGDKQTISLKEKKSGTSVTDTELRKPSLQLRKTKPSDMAGSISSSCEKGKNLNRQKQLLPEAACTFNNPVEEFNAEGMETTPGPNSSKQNVNDIALPINSPILTGSSDIHIGDFGQVKELVAYISSRTCDRQDQTNPSAQSQEAVKDLSTTETAINAGVADEETIRTTGDSFSGNRISLNFMHDDVEMTEGCTMRLLGIEIGAEVPGNTSVSAMVLAKPSDVLTSLPPSRETEKTPPQEGMQSTDMSAGSTQSIGGSVLHLASAFDEDGISPEVDSSVESKGPYFVSPAFAPTLTAIIKTHGDIAKDCLLKSNVMITCALERVCKAVCDLQAIRFNDLRSRHLQSLKAFVNDAELLKLNVAWLSKRHDELLEAVSLIKEKESICICKENSSLEEI